ncbi:MAG: hypothetical protein ACFFG0_16110 [Candidatus Thorarchaeota archaeon]
MVRDKWVKEKPKGIFNFVAYLAGFLYYLVPSIIFIIILSFFFPVIAIVVLIIVIFVVVVHILYNRNKVAKRNEYIAKQRKEYLAKEELYKYCNNCGDLVLEKLRTCPKCGQEFRIGN